MNAAPDSRKRQHIADLLAGYLGIFGNKTGWLSYHFAYRTPFGSHLLNALAECEMRVPGLGQRFIQDLAAVKYVPSKQSDEGWKARFEELIQKFSEILVARALCHIDWPDGTRIEFEPLNSTNGKLPEFSVTTPDRIWLFEVKCPSFITHQESRAANAHQLPIRSFLRNAPHLEGQTVTLPRDNTLKDFLASAQEKFEGFGDGEITGILIVIWDTRMYEAIGVLCHPEAGLLTAKTWLTADGAPRTFPDVSGAIIINRLEQLKLGAQERVDHLNPFELGGPDALPSTWCPNLGVGDLDPLVASGFDAFHFEGTAMAAEYSMMDYVLWFEAPSSIARHDRGRRRRRPLLHDLNGGTSHLAYGG